MPQVFDRPLHPQAEGFPPQPPAQLAVEEGLPELAGGQGFGTRLLVQTRIPSPQEVGAVEGVIVKGVGDRAGEGPGVEAQLTGGIPLPQPAPQRFPLGCGRHLRQEGQHAPHEPFGPPGVGAVVAGGRFVGIRQDPIHDPAQVGAGEGKAQVGGHAAQFPGQPFPQPAAGGPGVHHHLHRREGIGRSQAQQRSQQFGQDLGPVAAVEGQHGRWTP